MTTLNISADELLIRIEKQYGDAGPYLRKMIEETCISSTDGVKGSKKTQKTQKTPRTESAYIKFCKQRRVEITTERGPENKLSLGEMQKLLSQEWNSFSVEKKNSYKTIN